MMNDELYEDVQFALRWLAERAEVKPVPTAPPPPPKTPAPGIFASLRGLLHGEDLEKSKSLSS